MTQDDLLALLGRGLRQLTSASHPELTPDSDLYSSGIDSVQLLELVTWTEKELDIRLPDEKLYAVTDVRGLCDLITAELADRVAS
ncbi:acyl carrier protein [Nocardia pseudobrasiliensis]|uniref:Acyl carrier protein n=1 Tax=Nocardia pseudobrasiliensis TaxID=45979 RepID=A0A370IBP2_9NOCA|nr:acyl carrier protein [Nocardia pseudobrasiliensis]RDI68113.1 acyl carrier protein [Nocardia pseudobrasiliensis]